MHMFLRMMVHPRWAVEGEIRQSKHIEGRQERAGRSHPVEQILMVRERVGHDLVFAPEACERRYASDGYSADEEQPVGPGNLMFQSDHLTNVLLSRERVDHGSGGQEQQCLEEGMRHEMEDRRGIGADSATEKHIAELADSRIGQDPLDVSLDQADGGGEESCRSS